MPMYRLNKKRYANVRTKTYYAGVQTKNIWYASITRLKQTNKQLVHQWAVLKKKKNQQQQQQKREGGMTV